MPALKQPIASRICAGSEPQVGHHRARGGDLLLRDAAVGLGDIAHDAEGGAEEALADRGESSAGWRPGVAPLRLIELVAEQHADRDAERAPGEAAQDPPVTLPIHFMAPGRDAAV